MRNRADTSANSHAEVGAIATRQPRARDGIGRKILQVCDIVNVRKRYKRSIGVTETERACRVVYMGDGDSEK